MPLGDFGQPRLEAVLRDMLQRGRVEGSVLFEGPAGVGKEALAVELGRLVNCERDGSCAPRPEFLPPGANAEREADRCASCRKFDKLQHPDLRLIFPAPTGVWLEDPPTEIAKILGSKAADPYFKPEYDRPSGIHADVLREIVLPMLAQRPVEGRFKVIVLSEVDQMQHDIGNLLLKTLEEPPPDALLVLTSASSERLLATIHSRCQRLRFAPLQTPWLEERLRRLRGAAPAQARLAASLSQGRMRAAMQFLSGELQEVRDRAFEVMKSALAGDVLSLLELAQGLAQESSKRRLLPGLTLQMLAIVARDALLLSQGAASSSQGLVHADRAAELQRIAAAYAPEELRDIVRRAEGAERQIAGHASLEMTFGALFLSLSPHSDRPGAAAARA